MVGDVFFFSPLWSVKIEATKRVGKATKMVVKCYELPIIAKENNQNRKKSLRRERGADSTYVTSDFVIHTGCLNEILKLSKESDACSEMKAPPLCLPANTYA